MFRTEKDLESRSQIWKQTLYLQGITNSFLEMIDRDEIGEKGQNIFYPN